MMKIQIVGLGQFGMLMVQLFKKSGWTVWGTDVEVNKREKLESLGGIWGQHQTDVRMLCVFPEQYKSVSLPDDESLIVNVSSVQWPGIQALVLLGIKPSRVLSVHPLFGPRMVEDTGYEGQVLMACLVPPDPMAQKVLGVFETAGVVVQSSELAGHDRLMTMQSLAFLLGDTLRSCLGVVNIDQRFMTGSARQLHGLLRYVEKSPELIRHILSNPELRTLYPIIQKTLEDWAHYFDWEKKGGE